MADAYVFPETWADLRGHGAADPDERQRLGMELIRELAEEHPLFGRSCQALARCLHCDDVIFALDGGRYVRVHLSYPVSGPDRAPWPATEYFDTFEETARYVEHHAEYG